jgi:hypothetical protein
MVRSRCTFPSRLPDPGRLGVLARPVVVGAAPTRTLRFQGVDGQLVGEQERPIDWNKVLREMRAAGVRASGEELDEHDLEARWQRAEGPYARLGPPATVVPLAERLAVERPERTPESESAEEASGQLAFDLAA